MNRFVVMWDMYGLEYVASVDEPMKARTWAKLKGQDYHNIYVPNLNHLMLRARYNPQRNYEIFVVDTEPGITKQDLVDMFEADPQSAAETIRSRGVCAYGKPLSDHAKPVIT